jgi:hypothetical protein
MWKYMLRLYFVWISYKKLCKDKLIEYVLYQFDVKKERNVKNKTVVLKIDENGQPPSASRL